MDILDIIIDSKGKQPVENLLKMYYQTMGFPVKMINKFGENIYEVKWKLQKENPCTILHQDPEQAHLCHETCLTSCMEAVRWGDTYISHCHANFVQIGVPIIYNEKLAGGLVGCPFLMRTPSDQQCTKVLKKAKVSDDQKQLYMKLVPKIPVIPEKRIKLASELLFSLADFFSIPDLGLLNARRQLSREQAQVAEEIQRYKRQSNTSEHRLLPVLHPKKEKELITKVRVGDKSGAKTILNEFLGQAMLHNPINIELLKVYVLELTTILTRAVVEEGANTENILGLKYQFISELSEISEHESLCFWVVKVMESICDNIYQTRNNQRFHILEQACNHIRDNYQKKLTLASVAQHVYISPFYLCHLFKEDLHTTFGEFLTKTRIDAAKALIRETNYSLSQVALEVGFPDQSYFTKVFKKVEQITPKTYRRLSSTAL